MKTTFLKGKAIKVNLKKREKMQSKPRTVVVDIEMYANEGF